MGRLAGKKALVTGSSTGIGAAIARRFAAEKADVVINYAHDEASARSVQRDVEECGVKALVVKADVGNTAEIRTLFDTIGKQFGNIDILVNNAGIERNAPFLEATEEDFDLVMKVDLKGAFFAAQSFAKLVASRASASPGSPTAPPSGNTSNGKIINVSSVHEELPFPHFAAYCAAKGGLRMLARNLALELAPLGIQVNNVCPGAIETPINTKLLNDKVKLQALLRNIPLGRLGRPEDVASLCVFLASGESDYVTGSSYFVDGGLTWNYEEQ